MIRLSIAGAAALVLAAPAAAQEPEWRTAPEYDVMLRPFAIDPAEIRLRAGAPVRLRFVTSGHGRYSFSAPLFFANARLRSGDDEAVAGGTIVLGPGERRTIALVPRAGRYGARSRNFFQAMMGMAADIVVE